MICYIEDFFRAPRPPQPNPNTPQDDLVLPDDAVTIEEVDNTADLQTLVTTPGLVEDIVLADGTYTTTGQESR